MENKYDVVVFERFGKWFYGINVWDNPTAGPFENKTQARKHAKISNYRPDPVAVHESGDQCPIMIDGHQCIYVGGHSGEHYVPRDGRDHSDEIRVRLLRDDRDRLRLELQAARTDKTFEQWWTEDGRFYDPDTEDVPWFDKRKELAEYAFAKGVVIGMRRGV